MSPKVSVIVPVYNVELYLKECVDSIRNQTFRDIEIILIDDGSPDRCPQMCDQFSTEDERIRVVHQKNAGVSAARNLGIEMAAADWIMFVDSDDWLEENAIEVLYETTLTISCEIVVAFSFYNSCNQQWPEKLVYDRNTYIFPMKKYRSYLLGATLAAPYYYPDLFPSDMGVKCINLCSPCTKIYRKNILLDNNIRFSVQLKMCEDTIFNLQVLALSNQVCYIDRPLYHYRQRASSECHAGVEEHLDVLGVVSLCQSVDKRYIYIFTIVRLIGTIQSVVLKEEKISSCHELAKKLRIMMAPYPLCEEAIAAARYCDTHSTKHKLLLWLLKRRMYVTLVWLLKLKHKIFPPKKQHLDYFP